MGFFGKTIFTISKSISQRLSSRLSTLWKEKRGWPQKISELFINLKGFIQNPFFYLGLVSFVLLLTLSLGSNSLWTKKNFSFAALDVPNFPQTALSRLFLGPTTDFLNESPELVLIQKNSLTASTPPVLVSGQVLGSVIGGADFDSRQEVIEYDVQSGDTLKSVAEKFDISLNTLFWANNLNKNSKVPVGQELVILPVSGVLHHVQKGETVSGIAKKYKTESDKIVIFNELVSEDDIVFGDILVVPDGTMPSINKTPIINQTPLADSYFILPTKGMLTQGLHWYNAVDLANNCGSPVFAAAQGEVSKVKIGWNGGAGNYISLLHPNGVVTLYGHILKSLVGVGEQVSQGQMIALVGGAPGSSGAGISTGCHVHFEVRGAKNPFNQ